jgi:hypothetical protein
MLLAELHAPGPWGIDDQFQVAFSVTPENAL